MNFTNQQTFCLGGYKLDRAGNPLSGWTITVNDGKGDVGTNTTDENGFWQVCGLIPMTYNVSETLQDGWIASDPAAGYQDVILDDQNNLTVNFTNQQTFCLGGYKLDENNGPQEGWNITVSRDDQIVGWDLTDPAGYWEVCDLIQGNYTVSEVMQENWVAVDPQTGSQWGNLSTTNVTDVNFTNRRSLCLSGYKLDENNGPQEGWNITVSRDDQIVGWDLTDPAGYWEVCDLIQGNYTVSEVMQTGWIAVNPSTGSQWGNLTTSNLSNLNFTNNRLPGRISGIKWNDYNGNGIRDVNDNPLSGWVITLKYQNGTVVGSKTTGADGSYIFDNLAWEKYTLSETLKSGWKQTYPAGKTYTVEINATSLNVINRDFGNQLIPGCCNCPVKAYFTFKQVASPARTIQFTDASTGYVTDWSWNFGDGKTSVERNPLHTYSKAGTYTVKQYVQTIKCDGKTAWVSYTRTVTVK